MPIGISGSGGGGAWALFSSTTLSGDGTFDVASIPATFNDLLLSCICRGTRAAANDSLILRFNNDSAGNYDWQLLQGNFATATSAGNNAQTQIDAADAIPAASAGAGRFAAVEILVPGYASTTWNKQAICTYVSDTVSASNHIVAVQGGWWLSTVAISRVQLQGGITANLLSGSTLRIYGRT